MSFGLETNALPTMEHSHKALIVPQAKHLQVAGINLNPLRITSTSFRAQEDDGKSATATPAFTEVR